MSYKYMKLSIAIHGIDADEDTVDYLKGWLREATKAALLGHQRERFRFRNDYDSDIEVELDETSP